MREIWGVLVIITVFFTGCKSTNNVYSNTSFNRPYKKDPHRDYKGYNPNVSEDVYRRYNPNRNDDIMEELHSRKVENKRNESKN